MLLPIPMQVTNPRLVNARTQPVANVCLIVLNVLGDLLLPTSISMDEADRGLSASRVDFVAKSAAGRLPTV